MLRASRPQRPLAVADFGVRAPRRRRASVAVIALIGAAGAAAVALAATGILAPTPSSAPVAGATRSVLVVPDLDYSNVTIDADVPYGGTDGTDAVAGRTLDVCSPPEAAAGTATGAAGLPVVVEIHGGSWTRGDKADLNWRPICQWFASEGFVTVSLNYRLAPAAVFPAQLDDVSAAVAWLREPAQIERYGIDPERIAAFGGSAGGNLAALLGTTGTGPLTSGSRVAAVVELSGPSDLTAEGMADDDPAVGIRQAVVDYLGCASVDDCTSAVAASPSRAATSDDPPFLIAHSDAERIPLTQSERMRDALADAGVPADLVVVPGTAHSVAMLDDGLRSRILEFLRAELGVETPRTAVLSIEGSDDPDTGADPGDDPDADLDGTVVSPVIGGVR